MKFIKKKNFLLKFLVGVTFISTPIALIPTLIGHAKGSNSRYVFDNYTFSSLDEMRKYVAKTYGVITESNVNENYYIGNGSGAKEYLTQSQISALDNHIDTAASYDTIFSSAANIEKNLINPQIGELSPSWFNESKLINAQSVNIYRASDDRISTNESTALDTFINSGYEVYYFNDIFFTSKNDLFKYLVNIYFKDAENAKVERFRILAPNGEYSKLININSKSDWRTTAAKFIEDNCQRILKIHTNDGSYKYINANDVNQLRDSISYEDIPYLSIESNNGKKSWITDLNSADSYQLSGPIFYESNATYSGITSGWANSTNWKKQNSTFIPTYEDETVKTAIATYNSFFNNFIKDATITTVENREVATYDLLFEESSVSKNVRGFNTVKEIDDDLEITIPKEVYESAGINNVDDQTYKLKDLVSQKVQLETNFLYETSKMLKNVFYEDYPAYKHIYDNALIVAGNYRTTKHYNILLKIPLLHNYMLDKLIMAAAPTDLINIVRQYFVDVAEVFNDILVIKLGQDALKPSSVYKGFPNLDLVEIFNLNSNKVDFSLEKYYSYIPTIYPQLAASMNTATWVDQRVKNGLAVTGQDIKYQADYFVDALNKNLPASERASIKRDVANSGLWNVNKSLQLINHPQLMQSFAQDERMLSAMFQVLSYNDETSIRDNILDIILQEAAELLSANNEWAYVPNDNRFKILAYFVQEKTGTILTPIDLSMSIDTANVNNLLAWNNIFLQLNNDLVTDNKYNKIANVIASRAVINEDSVDVDDTFTKIDMNELIQVNQTVSNEFNSNNSSPNISLFGGIYLSRDEFMMITLMQMFGDLAQENTLFIYDDNSKAVVINPQYKTFFTRKILTFLRDKPQLYLELCTLYNGFIKIQENVDVLANNFARSHKPFALNAPTTKLVMQNIAQYSSIINRHMSTLQSVLNEAAVPLKTGQIIAFSGTYTDYHGKQKENIYEPNVVSENRIFSSDSYISSDYVSLFPSIEPTASTYVIPDVEIINGKIESYKIPMLYYAVPVKFVDNFEYSRDMEYSYEKYFDMNVLSDYLSCRIDTEDNTTIFFDKSVRYDLGQYAYVNGLKYVKRWGDLNVSKIKSLDENVYNNNNIENIRSLNEEQQKIQLVINDSDSNNNLARMIAPVAYSDDSDSDTDSKKNVFKGDSQINGGESFDDLLNKYKMKPDDLLWKNFAARHKVIKEISNLSRNRLNNANLMFNENSSLESRSAISIRNDAIVIENAYSSEHGRITSEDTNSVIINAQTSSEDNAFNLWIDKSDSSSSIDLDKDEIIRQLYVDALGGNSYIIDNSVLNDALDTINSHSYVNLPNDQSGDFFKNSILAIKNEFALEYGREIDVNKLLNNDTDELEKVHSQIDKLRSTYKQNYGYDLCPYDWNKYSSIVIKHVTYDDYSDFSESDMQLVDEFNQAYADEQESRRNSISEAFEVNGVDNLADYNVQDGSEYVVDSGIRNETKKYLNNNGYEINRPSTSYGSYGQSSNRNTSYWQKDYLTDPKSSSSYQDNSLNNDAFLMNEHSNFSNRFDNINLIENRVNDNIRRYQEILDNHSGSESDSSRLNNLEQKISDDVSILERMAGNKNSDSIIEKSITFNKQLSRSNSSANNAKKFDLKTIKKKIDDLSLRIMTDTENGFLRLSNSINASSERLKRFFFGKNPIYQSTNLAFSKLNADKAAIEAKISSDISAGGNNIAKPGGSISGSTGDLGSNDVPGDTGSTGGTGSGSTGGGSTGGTGGTGGGSTGDTDSGSTGGTGTGSTGGTGGGSTGGTGSGSTGGTGSGSTGGTGSGSTGGGSTGGTGGDSTGGTGSGSTGGTGGGSIGGTGSGSTGGTGSGSTGGTGSGSTGGTGGGSTGGTGSGSTGGTGSGSTGGTGSGSTGGTGSGSTGGTGSGSTGGTGSGSTGGTGSGSTGGTGGGSTGGTGSGSTGGTGGGSTGGTGSGSTGGTGSGSTGGTGSGSTGGTGGGSTGGTGGGSTGGTGSGSTGGTGGGSTGGTGSGSTGGTGSGSTGGTGGGSTGGTGSGSTGGTGGGSTGGTGSGSTGGTGSGSTGGTGGGSTGGTGSGSTGGTGGGSTGGTGSGSTGGTGSGSTGGTGSGSTGGTGSGSTGGTGSGSTGGTGGGSTGGTGSGSTGGTGSGSTGGTGGGSTGGNNVNQQNIGKTDIIGDNDVANNQLAQKQKQKFSDLLHSSSNSVDEKLSMRNRLSNWWGKNSDIFNKVLDGLDGVMTLLDFAGIAAQMYFMFRETVHTCVYTFVLSDAKWTWSGGSYAKNQIGSYRDIRTASDMKQNDPIEVSGSYINDFIYYNGNLYENSSTGFEAMKESFINDIISNNINSFDTLYSFDAMTTGQIKSPFSIDQMLGAHESVDELTEYVICDILNNSESSYLGDNVISYTDGFDGSWNSLYDDVAIKSAASSIRNKIRPTIVSMRPMLDINGRMLNRRDFSILPGNSYDAASNKVITESEKAQTNVGFDSEDWFLIDDSANMVDVENNFLNVSTTAAVDEAKDNAIAHTKEIYNDKLYAVRSYDTLQLNDINSFNELETIVENGTRKIPVLKYEDRDGIKYFVDTNNGNNRIVSAYENLRTYLFDKYNIKKTSSTVSYKYYMYYGYSFSTVDELIWFATN